MTQPTKTTAMAVVPLSSPFTGHVVFYTDTATPYSLWFTIPQGTANPTLTLITPGGSGATGGVVSPSTVNFWYNPTGTKVAVFYNTVPFGAGNENKLASTDFSLASIDPTNLSTMTVAATTTTAQSTSTGQITTPSNSANPSTTSVSSPGATTSKPPQKNGLSGGAVAGVAIGCLIAGALIAGLLAWFFWKRRKPAGARDSEASTVALMHREKGPAAKALSLGSGSPLTSAMENGLPQPLEDKAISGEVSKISNLIKNHVQSYYHSGRVSPISVDYDSIQALGSDLPVSVGTLSTLLGNSTTREIALRFSIAWVVVSRMQLKSPPNATFLPPEIAQCFQGMSYENQGPRAHAMFLAKWRSITAELLQSTYVRNPFSAGDLRLQNIQAAADILENVLRPYSDSRVDNGQRSRNLEEILKRAAQFAFTLFSQPSSWDFDWHVEQEVKAGNLCVFPTLVQVADENGEPIKPPRPFSEAIVRRLDE